VILNGIPQNELRYRQVTLTKVEIIMNKLLAALIAGLFAVSVNATFAADAPKADAKPAAEAAAPAAAEKPAAPASKKAHKAKKAETAAETAAK